MLNILKVIQISEELNATIFRQRSTVTGSLSTTTEDSTFQDILWRGC